MYYPISPMEQILNHMRSELEALSQCDLAPDEMELVEQIERDIQSIEQIMRTSGDVMTFH